MSATVTQPNNIKITYRGKSERERPRGIEKKAASLRKRGLISDKQADKLQTRKG